MPAVPARSEPSPSAAEQPAPRAMANGGMSNGSAAGTPSRAASGALPQGVTPVKAATVMAMQSAGSREALVAAQLMGTQQLSDPEEVAGAYFGGGGYLADSDSSLGGLDKLMETASSIESMSALAGRHGLPLPARAGSGRAGALPAPSVQVAGHLLGHEETSMPGSSGLTPEQGYEAVDIPAAVELLYASRVSAAGLSPEADASAVSAPAGKGPAVLAHGNGQAADTAEQLQAEHANGTAEEEPGAGGLGADLFAGLSLG